MDKTNLISFLINNFVLKLLLLSKINFYFSYNTSFFFLGQMCRSQYNKVKSLFGSKRSAQTQTECNVNNVITVETQTEPVISISNKKRYWTSLNMYAKVFCLSIHTYDSLAKAPLNYLDYFVSHII